MDLLGYFKTVRLVFACIDIQKQQIRLVRFDCMKQITSMLVKHDFYGDLLGFGKRFNGRLQVLGV